ncbi:hypothetical protein M3Y99_01874200 [Aphelenchoides fujianensis]|nr:hypothetical protein M3Y99_01874200 [Aphelenchoides fujianensis]
MYAKKDSTVRKPSGLPPISRKTSRLGQQPLEELRLNGPLRKQSAPLAGCRCLGPCRLAPLQVDCCVNLMMMSRKHSRMHIYEFRRSESAESN